MQHFYDTYIAAHDPTFTHAAGDLVSARCPEHLTAAVLVEAEPESEALVRERLDQIQDMVPS